MLFEWGVSSYFGWGMYGLNLLLAWAGREDLPAASLQPIDPLRLDIDPLERRLLAPALQRSRAVQEGLAALAGRSVTSANLVLRTINNGLHPGRAAHGVEVRSTRQVGVSFLDHTDFTPEAAARLGEHALVVAGSSWNRELLRQAGAPGVELVLQGVDPSHFHPAPRRGLFPGRFVVFSGGKLEYRKGQDLVIRAFRRFADRHPDALLLTAWSSPWPEGARSLPAAPDFAAPPFDATGAVDVTGWAALNGIAAQQIVDLGAVPNRAMPRIVREADAALFPNRAEGGTNLVAMECMACGVATILSANTGHLDLIGDGRCIALLRQTPIAGAAHRGWGDSDIDEIVAALETLYTDRQAAGRCGAQGARFMADLTWSASMDALAGLLAPLMR